MKMVRECLPRDDDSPRLRGAGRVALLYGAQFLAVGMAMPLLPVWLAALGLGSAAIGQVLAAQSFSRMLAQPVIARVADRTGGLREVMLACALLALLVSTWLGSLARGFWPILLGVAAAWFFFSPLIPLTEVLAVRVGERHGVAYGRMRLWGSLAFILGAMLAGLLLDALPAAMLIWAVVAAQFLTALGVLAQQRAEAGLSVADMSKNTAHAGNWKELLNAGFMLFLVVGGLVQASHAMLYGFAALHWRALGYSGLTIGGLVTAGVLAEVALFWFSGQLMRRVGAARLLMLGAAAAAMRWLGMAFDPPLPVLYGLQLLHAFTFGAAHLGAIAFIRTRAPARLAATAQAIYSSISMGLFMMLAMSASGQLYAAYGARAWLAMAAMAALAVPLAGLLRRVMPARS